MRPHISVDPTASVTATASGGGFPWFKVFAGCGCLMLVGVLGLGGVGYVAYSRISEEASSPSESEEPQGFFAGVMGTLEGLGAMQQGGGTPGEGESASAGEDSPGTSAGKNSRSSRDTASLDQLFDALDQPISRAQARDFKEAIEAWGNSREVREMSEQFETNKILDENEGGALAGLKKLRAIKGTMDRSQSLGNAFNAYVEEHGGRDFEERLLQFRLINRVTTAGNRNKAGSEPWSDAVAQALLDDHDAQRDEFLEVRQILIDATQDENFDPASLSEEERKTYSDAVANQFLLITGAINRKTLETWKALPAAERKAIQDQLNSEHMAVSSAMGAITSGNHDSMLFYGLFGL
ncbi:hypothetical protein EA187_18185 [Lujinxingia sediminis]|uniref:Uncharacterized protein n=1 Tax=Lujinxingia sediminis TaxID=2480984 RepID=A0ABY0CPG1_9DELT|nr:hypothetical protein [Lujinxingia sediminis]RVU41587.1 hypothetical protein EA187_18185 [Lujinxingia sediminis]